VKDKMADLSAMRANIARIRQQLLLSPVFQRGRPDSAEKADQEAAKLERFAENLRLIIRDLGSSEALIRLRESELPTIPRERRYSAEQSLQQLGENVRAVKEEAEALAQLVKDLLESNGLLNPIQRSKAMMDLMKELEKTAGHELQAQIAQMGHTSIGPVPHGSISIAGIIPPLAFAYLALKLLIRKLSRRSN
jgi:hypothetical protein